MDENSYMPCWRSHFQSHINLYLFVFSIFIFVANKPAFSQDSLADSLKQIIVREEFDIYDPSDFLRGVVADTHRLFFLERSFSKGQSDCELAYVYNMLGKNALNNTEYNRAREYFQKAYERALLSADEMAQIISLNMLGVVYRRSSSIKTSMEYYDRALQMAEKRYPRSMLVHKCIAVANHGIGSLYEQLKRYEDAVTCYRRALKAESNLGSHLGMAIDNHCLGDCYELMGLSDSALFFHEKSLYHNQLIKSTYGVSICYNSIARVYLRKEQPHLAYNYLGPALRMAKEAGDSSYITVSNINMGWYYLQTGRYDSANIYLQSSRALSQRTGNKALLLQSYDLLSTLSDNTGEIRKAFDYYRESRRLSEEIAGIENQMYITDITMLYDSRKKQDRIEQLTRDALMAGRVRKTQYIIIALLITAALLLAFFFLQTMKVSRKNKLLHAQKENLYNMQLEIEQLNIKRLEAENIQKDNEKKLLEEKLGIAEKLRDNERQQLKKEIEHKNRELAIAAACKINKSETLQMLLHKVAVIDNGNSGGNIENLKEEIQKHMDPGNEWESFSRHFESVHPGFFKKLKQSYHNLTAHELRLCAYVVMNLTTKETALLLCVSQDAVQKAKYRLKKKFSLGSQDSLFDFLLNFS